MFFDSPNEILKIASKNHCAIFVMPSETTIDIQNAIILKPEEKTIITIEQVKNLISRLSMRQVSEQYIIIRPAELLGDEAANAFLKNLEEPKDKVHFILVTEEPSKLLPTILSRAAIYFLSQTNSIDSNIKADVKVKDLTKRLIVAKPADLPKIAEEICQNKNDKRAYAMKVLETTIEMLYKSYFITKKDVFVKKIPKFLEAYENIDKNGHIKLHLVADLC